MLLIKIATFKFLIDVCKSKYIDKFICPQKGD